MSPTWRPRWGDARRGLDATPASDAEGLPPGPRVRMLSRHGCHLCELCVVKLLVLLERGPLYVEHDRHNGRCATIAEGLANKTRRMLVRR